MIRLLSFAMVGIWYCVSAHAQEAPAAPQRAFIIANLAQQLGQAELKADGLQTALIQAQKEVEDWKAAFGAWCGTAPNCGRPDK